MKQGCCKYCGEYRMVEVYDGADPEEADKKATKECECGMASSLRFFEANGMYEEEHQKFCYMILAALKEAQDMIESIQFKCAGNAYTVEPVGEKFKIKRRRTEKEEHLF